MSDTLILSEGEMREITGYKRPSSQRVWLEHNRIPFYVAASGRPIVLRSYFDARTMPTNGPPTYSRFRLAAPTVPPRR